MAAHTLSRRLVASQIAVIAKQNPDDPRLPGLRERADALHVAEIAEWARQAAALLPPLTHDEITKVAREVAMVSTRLRSP
jgi:hypothetical protein